MQRQAQVGTRSSERDFGYNYVHKSGHCLGHYKFRTRSRAGVGEKGRGLSHGGSSRRPEAARGLESRVVTGSRRPVGRHFDDAGGLEGAQKAFGRGLKCTLLEKSIFEGCI